MADESDVTLPRVQAGDSGWGGRELCVAGEPTSFLLLPALCDPPGSPCREIRLFVVKPLESRVSEWGLSG